MNESGPILRDIHLPADPSWWPPAPGWWLLLAVLLGVTWWLARVWRHRLRQRRWRRRVLVELEAIASQFAEHADRQRLLADVSRQLRRASLLLDPTAATLTGEPWLQFLDAHGGTDQFQHGVGHVLLNGPWQPTAEFDPAALLTLVREWFARALTPEQADV